MSKLDQLKALGAAKRAARANPFEDAARGRDPTPRNTPEASGTARIEVQNGKRRSSKAPRSQSSLLPTQRGARITPEPGKEPKADILGKVVSAGLSSDAPVHGLRRDRPDSSRVRSPKSEAETIHDGGSQAREETTSRREAGSGKVRHTMRELPSQAHLSSKDERGNTVRPTNTNPVAKATKGKAVPARKAKGSCKTPVTPADGVASRLGAGRTAQDAPQPSRAGAVAIQKRGRPKKAGPQPWEVEGIPRRTWYRRKREAEKSK